MGLYGLYDLFIAPSVCVYFPKYVRLRNERLGWLLFALRAGVVIFILGTSWNSRPWLESKVPLGSQSFWAERDTVPGAAMERADMASDLCNPATKWKYEYQYDAEGKWTYFNHTCKVLKMADRFVKGENELFIPTYTQDSWVRERRVPRGASDSSCNAACAGLPSCHAAGTEAAFVHAEELQHGVNPSECVCTCSVTDNYYFAGQEALEVHFEHSTDNPGDGDPRAFRSTNKTHNMLTIVRHAKDGRKLRQIQPGEQVHFQIKDLLDYADVHSLQDPATFTSANFLTTPGVVEYAPLRLTGLALRVGFNYVNAESRSSQGWDHDGPICFIEVSAEPSWTSKPVSIEYGSAEEIQTGEVVSRQKYQYGLRIKMSSTGEFSYLDILGIFLFLASSAVYLSFPMLLMHVLIWFFLGDLTDTMDDILHETPDWNAKFSSYVAVALAARHTYKDMNKADVSFDGEFRALAETLHSNDHGFTDEDFAAMRQVMLGSKPKHIRRDSAGVSEKEFLIAMAGGGTLKDVWRMFDPSQKRPLLQRLLDGNLAKRMRLVRESKTAHLSHTATIQVSNPQGESAPGEVEHTCVEQPKTSVENEIAKQTAETQPSTKASEEQKTEENPVNSERATL